MLFLGMPEKFRKAHNKDEVPLNDVVQSYEVFREEGGGNEGVVDRPSRQTLENEFGTSNDIDVVKVKGNCSW